LDGATLEQNLAMPFTLQIDPIPPDTAARVEALAAACGILPKKEKGEERDEGEAGSKNWLHALPGEVPPEIRIRAHLARAVALDPHLLLLEHPTANIPEHARAAFAADVVRVCESRELAALVITQDRAFAEKVAHRSLTLEPATGALRSSKRGWFR
jgi:ABC-type lipoprotein export system ATPase subunit